MSNPFAGALSSRDQLIDQAMTVLDDPLFRALQEPARVAVLREVLRQGRVDVSGVAAVLPQERSVISRHLQVLLDAGLLRVEREGRHRMYEVDGPEIVARFERILTQVRGVSAACCPAR